MRCRRCLKLPISPMSCLAYITFYFGNSVGMAVIGGLIRVCHFKTLLSTNNLNMEASRSEGKSRTFSNPNPSFGDQNFKSLLPQSSGSPSPYTKGPDANRQATLPTTSIATQKILKQYNAIQRQSPNRYNLPR